MCGSAVSGGDTAAARVTVAAAVASVSEQHGAARAPCKVKRYILDCGRCLCSSAPFHAPCCFSLAFLICLSFENHGNDMCGIH